MKKAVFITYNQALTERVAYLLDQLQIKGFTQWPLVNGAGTHGGEPRMGTHTWPEMNSATLTVVDEEMVPLILKYVKALDEVNKENGIRAFVWDITNMYSTGRLGTKWVLPERFRAGSDITSGAALNLFVDRQKIFSFHTLPIREREAEHKEG